MYILRVHKIFRTGVGFVKSLMRLSRQLFESPTSNNTRIFHVSPKNWIFSGDSFFTKLVLLCERKNNPLTWCTNVMGETGSSILPFYWAWGRLAKGGCSTSLADPPNSRSKTYLIRVQRSLCGARNWMSIFLELSDPRSIYTLRSFSRFLEA